jgi:hypothetical protein
VWFVRLKKFHGKTFVQVLFEWIRDECVKDNIEISIHMG